MSEEVVRYTIRENERFGSGQYGFVYLARKEGEKEGEKKLYVIKIPQEDSMSDEKKSTFNNEVDILNILSPFDDNKYTSIIYDFKKFDDLENEEDKKEENKIEESKIKENKIKKNIVEIKKLNDKNEIIETIESPFYVMDYFSKGLLFDYAASGKLLDKPKLIKIIFKRIIKSYQYLHSKGICHLDIKLDNIIFDEKFWPIIIDFGFSQNYKYENGAIKPIKVYRGSRPYATPELWKKVENINGEKADIFSLGAVLFNLVTGKYGFDSSESSDKKYRLIIKKNYAFYWKKIKMVNLSDDFKDLYARMVAYDPDIRPTFDEVLNSAWLEEVRNLNQNEEDGIINELFTIYNDIKSPNEINIATKIQNENLKTRSGESYDNKIFQNPNLKPKKISNNRFNLNKSIIIDGDFSVVSFMNSLAEEINKQFKDISYIEASKEKLKFEVTFDYEEEDEEEKEEDKEKEEKEEDKEEEEKEEEKIEEKSFGNCRMLIELFKKENGKYLLEFIRTGGNVPSYNHHFLKLKEIITKKNLL